MGQDLTKETALQLLHHGKSMLDNFNSANIAVDAYTIDYFDNLKLYSQDDPVRITITEIFAGCIQYENALNTVIKGFYNVEGRTIPSSEQNLYRIFAYIIIFRLEEFGIKNLQQVIRTQQRKKMFKFLNFLLEPKNLYTWMKDEWAKLYDHTFVENEIIGPLEIFLPLLTTIVEKLKEQIEHGQKHTKKPITGTEVKPFNLTQPVARAVPMPEEIPQIAPVRSVPKTQYEAPEVALQIEEVRRQNRMEAERRLMTANVPACAGALKSEKTLMKMQEIEEERLAQLKFNAPKAKPIPTSVSAANNSSVKLNAAAIMREWARYKEAEQHELKKLKALEAGAFDSSAYEDWYAAQQEADTAMQLAELERKKILGQISYEEAILAKQRLTEEKRGVVEELKQEAAEREAVIAEMRAIEEIALKKRMAEILASHENTREAVQDMKKEKAAAVAAIQQENAVLLAQAYEEAAEELRRKMELIAQIRAIEAQQVPKERLVDLTQTAGYGFLSEMSIIELKERLSLAKQRQKKEEEERRDTILENKEAKDADLLHKLEIIGKHRAEKTKAAALAEKKQEQKPQAKPDPKVQSLQEELARKREMRQQLQEQKKQNQIRPPAGLKQLTKEKKIREAARWSQLEESRERLARLETSGVVTGDAAAADRRILQKLCS